MFDGIQNLILTKPFKWRNTGKLIYLTLVSPRLIIRFIPQGTVDNNLGLDH